VDKITRRELKHDRFAQEVGHTVEYVSEHRRQIIRYSAIGLGVLVVLLGIWFYNKRQGSLRQTALKDAMRIRDAVVGAAPNDFILAFPTQEEKDKASIKAFTDLAVQHDGTEEGTTARYYLGVIATDQGKLADAEKHFKMAVESGSEDYASIAKLSMAQIYAAQGKPAEAEKLLRPLIEKPTIFVSKEQAIIALARALASSKPAEARKLLEPLRAERSAVSRVAITALGEISAAR
jgi:predicted negative regulator of RcsB-dependent stress response